MTIHDWSLKKSRQEKIAMVTCYDAWSAQLINDTAIDAVLVGDSVGMVMYGDDNTFHVTIDVMAKHTSAVSKVCKKSFIITDMPFLADQKGLTQAMDAVEKLVLAGAKAVKIEGLRGKEKIIKHIINAGIPVMGHLGLTLQHLNQIGGFKVQGKTHEQAEEIFNQAKQLEDLGVFAVVLECIPSALAKRITENLQIPTIGIGAGNQTDGQILVLHDMLGLNPGFKAKFVKTFMNGGELVQAALNQYASEVKNTSYPDANYTYE